MPSVLNVSGYKFFSLKNIPTLKSWCLSRAGNLKGTIILAEEGVNFSLSGDPQELDSFCEEFFSMIGCSCPLRRSYSNSIVFNRFFVKTKKEAVAYRSEGSCYTPLAYVLPQTFHQWLIQGHDNDGHPLFLIDVRNQFEYEAGTFPGAYSIHMNSFNEFQYKMNLELIPDNHTIVTFCTGGIRCEKASHWFRSRSVERAYQLEGGILRYFEEIGQGLFVGDCFVFDQRRLVNGCLQPVCHQC